METVIKWLFTLLFNEKILKVSISCIKIFFEMHNKEFGSSFEVEKSKHFFMKFSCSVASKIVTKAVNVKLLIVVL